MISSIIVDALARRARSVSRELRDNADVADFRAAFEDELKRFDNAPVPATSTAPRAKLITDSTSTQPSLGRGLGQQTGGTAQSDAEEAIKILRMIGSCPWDDEDGPLSASTRRFINEQFTKLSGLDEAAALRNYKLTGKMLFWLRDAKDKLIEKGIL